MRDVKRCFSLCFLVLVVAETVNNLSLLFVFMVVLILHISAVLFRSRAVRLEEGTSFIVQKTLKPVHSLCVCAVLDWAGLLVLAVGVSLLRCPTELCTSLLV